MKKLTKYSLETRERAVCEHQDEHESQWAVIRAIAGKIGCVPETLRVSAPS